MIKITLKNAPSLLKVHYEKITTKKGKEWNLLTFLNNRIKNAGNTGRKALYEHLKCKIEISEDGNFNSSILTAPPLLLEEFVIETENKFKLILEEVLSTNKKGVPYTIRKDLRKVFFYHNYDKWGAYKLAEGINLSVCPYCNRSYSFTIGSDLKKGTRPEFDHFMNKAQYPYLGLSFYNLIPSCHICNSNLKKDEEFNLENSIHPYIEGFGQNYVFSIQADNVSFIDGISESFQLKLKEGPTSTWDANKIAAAKYNADIFRLEELYNHHKDYVDEILVRKKIYSEEYLNSLYNQFEGLFTSPDDVRRVVYANYLNEEDYSKRVLSKLTVDIMMDLEENSITANEQ